MRRPASAMAPLRPPRAASARSCAVPPRAPGSPGPLAAGAPYPAAGWPRRAGLPLRRLRAAAPPLARRRLCRCGPPWRSSRSAARPPASAPPPCARPAPRSPLPRSGRAVPPRACLAARRPRPRRAEQAKQGRAPPPPFFALFVPRTSGTRGSEKFRVDLFFLLMLAEIFQYS